MDISERFALVVDEQLQEFGALKTAVEHVNQSNPAAIQRVILCNNLVVGLTARVEESLRQVFSEYLKIVEDSDAKFFQFRESLKKSAFESALVSLKRRDDWENVERKVGELHALLSGETEFRLAVVTIVDNQGNMRSSQVTDIAKRIGVDKIWIRISDEEIFSNSMNEEKIDRRANLIIQKWNEIFDERDRVVHRVSQASGWSVDKIIEHITFCEQIVKKVGSILSDDCMEWHARVNVDQVDIA